MEINVKELSIILNRLGNLVEEYELNHLSYYNELNSTSSFWNSKNNEILTNEIDNQKVQIDSFISFLKSYILIFYRLVGDLSNLGDYVKFDMQNKDKILDKLNEILTSYDEIIKIYNDITYEESSLFEQKNELEGMSKEVYEIKEFINKIYVKLNDMNIFMKSKIDALDEIIIKEEELV